MKSSIQFVFICVFTMLSCGYSQESAIFSADNIQRHLSILGHDSLQGRGTGSPGAALAAKYIKDQLQSFGVAPMPSLNEYSQNVPIHGALPLPESRCTIIVRNDTISLSLFNDYLLYSSGDQTFIGSPAPLIFVGYGIIAPEYDYNDYQNIDVRNSVVVFFTGEPPSTDPQYFDGERTTLHSSSALKQKIALARGAQGSIEIPVPLETASRNWKSIRSNFSFEEARLMLSASEHFNAMIHPDIARAIFADAPYSFDEVVRSAALHSLKSFSLNAEIQFHGKFFERDFLSQNVLGVILGDDLRQRTSFLLLTAHYDHLGIGPSIRGDSIYNGVFDNAAGVAVLLELARVLAMQRHSLKRSVVVCFLTGEERGFLGSQYYCLHPAVPLYKTIANINIDGVSLFEECRSFSGIGASFSTLGTVADSIAGMYGLAIEQPPEEMFGREMFSGSDQFIFAQAGIPSMLITEGLQYKNSSYMEGLRRYITWSNTLYHSPFDDLSQQINYHAAVQYAVFVFHFSMALVNTERPPEWYPASPFLPARIHSTIMKK